MVQLFILQMIADLIVILVIKQSTLNFLIQFFFLIIIIGDLYYSTGGNQIIYKNLNIKFKGKIIYIIVFKNEFEEEKII